MAFQKDKIVLQPSISDAMLVSGRVLGSQTYEYLQLKNCINNIWYVYNMIVALL